MIAKEWGSHEAGNGAVKTCCTVLLEDAGHSTSLIPFSWHHVLYTESFYFQTICVTNKHSLHDTIV